MDLRMRIDLLEKSKQIDSEVKANLYEVIACFKNFGIELTEENGQMLITHMGKALMRVKEGKEVEKLDSSVFQEATSSHLYEKAKEIFSDLEKRITIQMPGDEKRYIIINIIFILEGDN